MFNVLSFALIVAVDVVIKNELLTYALIVWGSVLLFRLVIHMLLDNARADVKFGRASNWRQ
jgi:hypothetical protein